MGKTATGSSENESGARGQKRKQWIIGCRERAADALRRGLGALPRRQGQQIRILSGGVLCLLLLALIGCAPKLYSIDMRYQPTKARAPALTDGRKYSMTVASFVDRRKIDDTLLIGRVLKSDGRSIPVLPKTVRAADAMADALRQLLGQAGYAVSPERPVWDLEEGSILPGWGTLLVGGAIEELEVVCLDAFPRKRYSARARITLIFADVQQKRIFYRIAAESSSSLEHILFSEERLEEQINGVLSDVLEKAIEGPETASRIREALNR